MVNILIAKDSLQIKQFIKIVMLKHKIDHNQVLNIDFAINDDLENQLNQIGLFTNPRIFMIYNANFLNSTEGFKKYTNLFNLLNQYFDKEILVYLISNKKILTNADFKNQTKSWNIHILKDIDENEKIKIINELIKNNDIFLDKDVYNCLIKKLDNCYGNIFNEIEKLTCLLKTKSSNQTAMELITNYNSENIFHLFEAVLTKNHKLIWKIYNDLMIQNEDEISVINALASQTQNLYFILNLLKQHYPLSAIANLTNVSIYYINLYKTKFINYNIDNINNLLLYLYELEINIKLSKIDKNLGFKQFLLKMSH